MVHCFAVSNSQVIIANSFYLVKNFFKVFSDYLKFVLLFSNNSDIISSIQSLVNNNFNYF